MILFKSSPFPHKFHHLLIASLLVGTATCFATEKEDIVISQFSSHLLQLKKEGEIWKTKSQEPSREARPLEQKTDNSNKEVGTPIEEDNSTFGLKKSQLKDLRKKIEENYSWPSSVHGLVKMKFANTAEKEYSWGTGTIIGPNLVLTAAHNLFSRDQGEAKEVYFLPAMGKDESPYRGKRGIVVNYRYFPEAFRKSTLAKEAVRKEDYGLLILEDAIGEETGYFGLGIVPSHLIDKATLHISGYPGDMHEKDGQEHYLYDMEGKVVKKGEDSKDYLHYDIYTAGGQSGSGVWYKSGEDYLVVGVHVLGDVEYNRATLLTRERFDYLAQWVKQAIESRVDLLAHLPLQKIDLEGKHIGDFGVKRLMSFPLPHLKKLNLARNEVGDEGAKELAKNTTLIKLNLWDNKIGNKGASALAKNTTLTSLGLHANKIGDEGASALAKNTTLTKLGLWNNKIGNKGASALAKNTTLTFLVLGWNNVGDEGASALAKNTTLTSLILVHNKVRAEGASALAKNTTLTEMEFWYNKIGDEGRRAIEEMLERNKQLKLLPRFHGTFLDQAVLTFYVEDTVKDIFDTLGFNGRNEALTQLANKVIENDQLREIVFQDIKASSKEESLMPRKITDTTRYQKIKTEKQFENHFKDADNIVNFIVGKYQENEEVGISPYILQALAEMKQRNVYIWSVSAADSKELILMNADQSFSTVDTNPFHLLHTAGEREGTYNVLKKTSS